MGKTEVEIMMGEREAAITLTPAAAGAAGAGAGGPEADRVEAQKVQLECAPDGKGGSVSGKDLIEFPSNQV